MRMRQSITLAILASVNIVLLFLQQWYLVVALGSGAQTDAFIASMTVPQLILSFTSGSLVHVLVPLLAVEKNEGISCDRWTFFCGIGIFFLVLGGILFVSASTWVPWTVPGFDSSRLALAISMSQIQLLNMVLTSLIAVLCSIHYAREQFHWVELSNVISGILGLTLLLWGLQSHGVTIAAWAMVVRAGMQLLLLLHALGPYRRPDWRSPAFRSAMEQMRPLTLGAIYYRTDQLADRLLASLSPAGAMTILHLGQQIHSGGSMVLNKAIATPMVPALARLAASGNWDQFRKEYLARTLAMLALSTAACAFAWLFGESLLTVLFQYNRFNSQDVHSLWIVLIALGGMLIGGAIGQVLSSSFYAFGNTSTPTKVGVAGFTLGLILKGAGFYFAGVPGIAAGTSAYYLINGAALYGLLNSTVRGRSMSSRSRA